MVNCNQTSDAIVARARKAITDHEEPHFFFLGKSADNYKSTNSKSAEWHINSFNDNSKFATYKQYYVVTMMLTDLRKGRKHQNHKTVKFGCTCPAFETDRFKYCKESLF